MKYISIPKFVITNSTVINATIIALHYTSQMVIGINRSTVSILIDIQRGSTMVFPSTHFPRQWKFHPMESTSTRIFIREPLNRNLRAYVLRPTLRSFVIDLFALKDVPRRRIFLPPRQRGSRITHTRPPPVHYSLSKLSRKYSPQTISVAFFAFVRLLTIISEP